MALEHQFEFANQSISEVENGRENCLVNLYTNSHIYLLASHECLLFSAQSNSEVCNVGCVNSSPADKGSQDAESRNLGQTL